MPFYFDLSVDGVAGDADARAFVVAARKELGGNSVPTPPVLLMDSDGNVLGEADNFSKPDRVLEVMLRALKEHPEFGAETEAEAKAVGIERAELSIDLQDLDGARKALDGVEGAGAAYLLGRLARFRQEWDDMETHFARIDDKALEDDVRMERAYRWWSGREFEKLRDHLKDFPKDSNRFTEARYYEGIALHHLKEREAALKVWKSEIDACAQDPWIYRADWAYTNVQDGGRASFSGAKKSASRLGRIGYMGSRNPDLKGP